MVARGNNRGLGKHHVCLLAVMLALVLPALAAAQSFLASQDEPHGIVITGVKQSGKLIFPVEIYRVNGQRINFRDSSLPLKPGQYTLQAGRAVINRDVTPGLRGDVSRPDTSSIDIEVEAGQAYYLGLHAEGSRAADWELVVWKTEPGGRAVNQEPVGLDADLLQQTRIGQIL